MDHFTRQEFWTDAAKCSATSGKLLNRFCFANGEGDGVRPLPWKKVAIPAFPASACVAFARKPNHASGGVVQGKFNKRTCTLCRPALCKREGEGAGKLISISVPRRCLLWILGSNIKNHLVKMLD